MTGLMACLEECLAEVWACAADVMVSYTLHRHTGGSFDPASGTATTPTAISSDIGHMRGYTHQQLANQALRPTDAALLCRLSTLGATPNAGDWVVIDGIIYDVISVRMDSARLTAECQLRRRGSST